MKKEIAYLSGIAAALLPAVAFAQKFDYVNNWLNQGIYWLQLSTTLITILLTVFFLLSVFRFVSNKDPKNIPDLRQNMINGMIGLFVAIGIWGILRIAGGVLGVDTTKSNSADAPTVTCPPGLRYIPASHVCG